MKRTIKEVYDLIVKKRDNALNDEKANENDRFYLREITGAINAYEDVLCLIDSSHLLEEDEDKEKKLKALEVIKNKQVNVNMLKICSKIGGRNNYNENYAYKQLTQEEYDLLKEVLL